MASQLPNADDLLGKPSADELLGPEPAQAQGAPTESGATPSLWPRVWDDLQYVGKRFAQGALNTGLALARGNPLEAGSTPATQARDLEAIGAAQAPGALESTLGLGAPANVEQKYGGAVAQAAGADPISAGLFPISTALGAVGGQLGGDLGGAPGAIAGGFAGGSLGALGHSLVGLFTPTPNKTEILASMLGGSKTLQESGAKIGQAAQAHLDTTLPQLENLAHEPVNAKSTGTQVPLDSYLDVLDRLKSESQAGPLAASAQTMRPNIIDGLDRAAENVRPDFGGAVPSWDNAKYFRSRVGDAMRNPKNPMFSLDADAKNAIYSALTSDMQKAAEGGGFGSEFQNANSVSSGLRSHAENFISPLVKDGMTPGQVVSGALKGSASDGTRLQALADVMPSEVSDLGAALLRTKPESWLKLAPEAREAIAPNPSVRKLITDHVTALTKTQSPVDNLSHRILGSEAAAAIAVLAGHALLPGAGEITAGAGGQLLGLSAPLLARAGARAATSPRPIAGALAGGSVGGNPLFPGQ